MKKVMVFGTFDIFHSGHENFLQQARQYGDYIVAVIARDATVAVIKGKAPKNNEAQRARILADSHLVDEVIFGSLGDKYEVIAKHRPEIICLGYDQNAFTDNLVSQLERLGLEKTKIIRLNPFQPELYKSSIISEERKK